MNNFQVKMEYYFHVFYAVIVILGSVGQSTPTSRLSIHREENSEQHLKVAWQNSDLEFHTLPGVRERAVDHNIRALVEPPSDSSGIPDPQMLDPKDVAVLYQLQTVTQPPSQTANVGKPYFGEPPARRVTTRAGQTASLSCIVRNIGDRQVSWIRGKDLHVLSSGLNTFATDARVTTTVSGSVWTLMIHYSQPRDGGAYACQINTQPPIATWFNLTVIEAKAIIEGQSTLYVQEGSNISLSCIIKEELVIPGIVLWYHGDALVPRDSPRIRVLTTTSNVTTSQLNITGVTTGDTGNYSCWPSSGKPDNVLVHVIQGDPPAAMQHGNSSPRPSPQLRAFLTLLTWLTPFLILPGWFSS